MQRNNLYLNDSNIKHICCLDEYLIVVHIVLEFVVSYFHLFFLLQQLDCHPTILLSRSHFTSSSTAPMTLCVSIVILFGSIDFLHMCLRNFDKGWEILRNCLVLLVHSVQQFCHLNLRNACQAVPAVRWLQRWREFVVTWLLNLWDYVKGCSKMIHQIYIQTLVLHANIIVYFCRNQDYKLFCR